MKTRLLLLLCARAEDPSDGVMRQTLPSSSCWQCPGIPRGAGTCSHSHQLWHQGAIAGISLAHDQWEFLKSTLAVRAGLGWAFRGKEAVFSSGWQRAVCLLACSTGTSVPGEAQLARAEVRCDCVLLSWVLIHKSPYTLQGRHP